MVRKHPALLGLFALCLVAAFSSPSAGTGLRASEKGSSSGELWAEYYQRTTERPPRPVLVEALRLFERDGRTPKRAVDAGCGAGTDTVYLLRQGIAVHAFDLEPRALEALEELVPPRARLLLTTEVAAFHEARWGRRRDLVFAGYSLPFSSPESFPETWRRLRDSLSHGGRFAGHFFGDRDDWAGLPGRSHHTREEVEALFDQGFEIEVLREIEKDQTTALGNPKHWHIFEVIARRVR